MLMLLFSGSGDIVSTGYLDAAELADIRADFQARMPDPVFVLRNTLSSTGIDGSDAPAGSDGFGGQTESWAIVAQYTGRLYFGSMRAIETSQGGQVHALANPTVVLPWNASVRDTDRLQIAGHLYEVTDSTSDKSEAFQLTVYLRRLTPTAN